MTPRVCESCPTPPDAAYSDEARAEATGKVDSAASISPTKNLKCAGKQGWCELHRSWGLMCDAVTK